MKKARNAKKGSRGARRLGLASLRSAVPLSRPKRPARSPKRGASKPAAGGHDAGNQGEGWTHLGFSVPLGMLVLVLTLVPLQMLDKQGLPRCRALQAEKAKLSGQNEALRAKVRSLRGEIEALRNDPRAIERLARHELGLVRSGELIYQFVP